MPRYSAETRLEALRRYADGASCAAVARDMGLKTFTVKEWAAAAGIIRTMSEAASLSVSTRPRGYRAGKFLIPNRTTGRDEIADSSYEAARMVALDADPSIAFWSRARDRIPYTVDGRRRTYNPDILIRTRSGETIVEEIKPTRFLDRPGNAEKFAAAREFYAQAGIAFVIRTEADIDFTVLEHVDAYRATAEQRKARAKQRRQERFAERVTEPVEVTEARRRTWATKARARRQNETTEKREARLADMRERGKAIYHSENEEARRHRKQRRARNERMRRRRLKGQPVDAESLT